MISGAIFMTHTMEDNYYLHQTMNQIDRLISKELQQ